MTKPMTAVQQQTATRYSPRRLRKLLASTALIAAGAMALSHGGPAKAQSWDSWTEKNNFDVSTNGNVTDITTSAARAGGTSNNLDIAAGDTVNVHQGDSANTFFARAADNADPTDILGSLWSDGRIIITDRNGVFFGAGSRVDTAGIIASTGDLDMADFLAGNTRLTFENLEGSGDIEIAAGATISVRDAGLAAFVSPFVSNNGIISARLGTVAFAAGQTITVDLYGDGLYEIGVNGKLGDALLENKGTVAAESGTIIMTAEATKNVVDSVINMDGIATVGSVTQQGGKIILAGGSEGAVTVDGTMTASGATGGGEISVTGEDIDVSEDAIVSADAVDNGDGGTVYFYANRNALYRGRFSARGGAQAGNGGFIEISAANQVGYSGQTDTSAPNGEAGSVLIDPFFATIHSGSWHNELGFDYVLSAERIADDMGRNGDYRIQADEWISVGSDFDLPLLGIGGGPIDLSTYDYDEVITPGFWTDGYWGGWGVGWVWGFWTPAVTQPVSGTTDANLILQSDRVFFKQDLTMGYGDVRIIANEENGIPGPAPVVNLNARLYGYSPQDEIVLLGDDRLFNENTDPQTINVLSDNALIQQALGFAEDGDTINVEAGTYNESLTVDKSVEIYGAQRGNDDVLGRDPKDDSTETIINPNSPAYIITADDVVIDSMVLNGFLSVGGGSDRVVKVEDGADNAVISNNIFFTDINGTGPQTDMPIELYIEGDNATVRGNLFHRTPAALAQSNNGNNTSNGNPSIRFENADDATVEDNILQGGNIGLKNVTGTVTVSGNDVSGTASDGIWLWNINNTALALFDVRGNSFDAAMNGIKITGPLAVATKVAISDNTIDAALNGILIEGDIAGATVEITGNDNIKAGESGIYIAGGEFSQGAMITLDKNRVRDAKNGAGIYIADATRGGAILEITRNSVWRTGTDGIYVADAGGALRIENNNIGYFGSGLTPVGGTDVIGDEGIDVNGAPGAQILDNNVTNTASNGISLNPSNGALVQGNLVNNVNGDAINVNGSTDVDILGNFIGYKKRDLELFGDDNIGGVGVNVYNGANNVDIKENEIIHTVGAGVRYDGSGGGFIKENIVRETNANGIEITNATSAVNIVRNEVYKAGLDGIYAEGASNFWISGNTVEDAGEDGIHLHDSIATNFGPPVTTWGNDSEIVKNTVRRSGEKGIHVSESAFVVVGDETDTTKRNTVEGGQYGIYIDNTDDVFVNHNNVSENSESGVEIRSSQRVSVSYNDVFSAGKYGIRYAWNSDDGVVTGNTVNGDDDTATGIKIEQGSDFTTIDGNTVHGTTGRGIWAIRDIKSVSDNTVYDTGDDAIEVSASPDVLIEDNWVGYSAQTTGDYAGDGNIGLEGIDIDGSARAQVKGNYVAGTVSHGISLNPSDGALIEGNDLSNIGANAVNVAGSAQVKVIDNDIDGADKGVFADNAMNLWVYDNDIEAVTTAGVHITNTNAGNYGGGGSGDVDIWKNRIGNSAGATGVWVENSAYTTVGVHNNNTFGQPDGLGTGNNITGVADAIVVTGSKKAMVRYNTVETITGTAVTIGGSENATARDNKIDGAKTGIRIEKASTGAQVVSNDLDNITVGGGNANDAIRIHKSKTVNVALNTIDNTGDEGIYATGNVDGLTVVANIINNTGLAGNNKGNAIELKGTKGYSLIDSNVIGSAGHVGIFVNNPKNNSSYDVTGNIINGTDKQGILIEGKALNVSGNTVANTDDHGIQIQNSPDVIVEDNWVGYTDNTGTKTVGTPDNIDGNGIFVQNSNGAQILVNYVTEATGHGIAVNPSDNVVIEENFAFNNNGNGFAVEGGENVTLSGNEAYDNGGNGINVSGNEGNVIIEKNTVYGNDGAGAAVRDSLSTEILFNTIHDNGAYGFYGAGGNSSVALVGNIFGLEPTDETPVHVRIESGEVDLTRETNFFNFGGTALQFSGPFPVLSLVDDTIGTQFFNGQGDFFVELQDGAFFDPGTPTVLDATDSFYVTPFGVANPSSTEDVISLELYAFLEEMFEHFIDDSTLGLFFFGDPDLDQEDILRGFGAFDGLPGDVSFTLTGLPFVDPALALAALAPQAGDDDETTAVADITALEPAAGPGQEQSCWSDVVADAAGGTTVTYSFSYGPEAALNDSASCQTGG